MPVQEYYQIFNLAPNSFPETVFSLVMANDLNFATEAEAVQWIEENGQQYYKFVILKCCDKL